MEDRITIDFTKYKRLEKAKEDLNKLREDLRACFNTEVNPITIDIAKLKTIAKSVLSELDRRGNFIDV